MKDNYCTYKRDGRFFIGVFCLNGQVFEGSKKREERGEAVKDAARARKEELSKIEKAKEPAKKTPAKPLSRKTVKSAPVATA